MCMDLAPPERRECVPASSGANPSLAAPTWRVSALMIKIIFEALTEQRPWVVGYYMTGVVAGHSCSHMWKKMLTPARNGQASGESDLK